jgi:hypothetical protein
LETDYEHFSNTKYDIDRDGCGRGIWVFFVGCDQEGEGEKIIVFRFSFFVFEKSGFLYHASYQT